MLVEQRAPIGWILCIALACLAVCSARPARSAEAAPVPAIDATHGVALEGYDAVAYFLDHRPIRGIDAYSHTWSGVVWKFASAEHRDLFAADPERYAPQYGGYCAFAVANRTTAHGSPKQWAVVNEPVSEQQSAGEKALGPGPARAHPGWRPELAPDPEARVAG